MNKVFENDLVSIIMPAYNCAEYIEESIASVLKQTYPKWELLIIDDCSKDETEKIIKKYIRYDNRIKYKKLKINQGVAIARNTGIRMAKGQYLAFLDSDDLWIFEKLECQINFMKKKKVGFSCTQYRQFTDYIGNCSSLIDVKEKIDYKELLKGNVIGCLTVMIDRKYISQIFMALDRHEDYITWLQILKRGFYVYGLKKDLARYRKNLNSLSGNKFKSLLWTWNVYRKNEKLTLLKTIYYLLHYSKKVIKKHF